MHPPIPYRVECKWCVPNHHMSGPLVAVRVSHGCCEVALAKVIDEEVASAVGALVFEGDRVSA